MTRCRRSTAAIGSRAPWSGAMALLVEVPLGEALDLVARRLRETSQQHGKDSVAVYGSAQWTIPDAYVASKLFKGALGTNNVETSARLYAASAMAGLESSFGLDGAIGCYEDIDHADVFVLWDTNLAETDPVLFSRMLDRRRANPAVRIIDLATRTTRTSYAADRSLLHVPHAGLAIANAICQEIVARKLVHREFVDRYVAFKRGKTDIGYGLSDDALVAEAPEDATWDEYVAFLADYTPERAQEMSGLSAESIRWLASLYGDPARKVMSVWGTEVNQDVRGTWLNNAALQHPPARGQGGIAGEQPLLHHGTTQRRQRGARRGHVDAHAAAGRGADARRTAGGPPRSGACRWRTSIPGRRTPPCRCSARSIGATSAFSGSRRPTRWSACPTWTAIAGRRGEDDRFIVVSEAYPTPTTDVADVVLPAAMWIEREGVFANVERRVQHFEQMVPPPGDATSDAWQMIEVARRLGFAKLFP